MTERKKSVQKRVSFSPRLQAFMDGELSPEEFTDEEVARMQLTDRNGHFQGRPPGVMPRELAIAFRTESQKRLVAWFQEQVPTAQKVFRNVMLNGDRDDTVRLRAAEAVFERVIGKVPNNSDIRMVVDDKRSFEDHTAEIVADLED